MVGIGFDPHVCHNISYSEINGDIGNKAMTNEKQYSKSYFSKVIKVITATVMLLVFVVSIVNYVIYKNMLHKTINDNFAMLTRGIRTDIDNTDESLRSLCEYMYINNVMAGNIFSKSSGDIDIYADIRSVYSCALSANNNIDSIQFYNAYTGKMYCAGGAMDEAANQLDDIMNCADRIVSNTMVLRTVKYIENMKIVERPVFSYFIYESSNISRDSSFLVVNLKCEWLMDCVERYSKLDEDNKFFIFNYNTELFMYSNEAELKGYETVIRDAVDNKNAYVSINGRKYVLNTVVMEEQGLTICSLVSAYTAYKPMYKYMRIIFIFSLLVALLGIYFSYFTARRIYDPFDKLYKEIAISGTDSDEFENIKWIFNEYSNKIKLYEKRIDSESRIIKSYYFSKLMKNSEELSEAEIERIFSYLSVNIEYDVIVAVLCIDEMNDKIIYDDSLMNYALYNIAAEVMGDKYHVDGEPMFGERVEFLINVDEDADYENTLRELMNEIKKHMKDNFGINISMSISMPVKSVEEISKAEAVAVQNLFYRFNYGYGSFFTENTVRKNKRNTKKSFSSSYEELLINSADEKSAIAVLGNIIEEIKSMSYVNAIAEGVRLSKILRDRLQIDEALPIDIVNKGLMLKNTLPGFYREVCGKLSVNFMSMEKKNERDIERRQIADRVKAYIEEHFSDSNTCITDAAKSMGISQRRLSEIFREEENTTFVSYLTKFRVEKAKEYILKGDLSVKEVSEMVGITNDTYFYKLFRNVCGMTPSEYKKYYNR